PLNQQARLCASLLVATRKHRASGKLLVPGALRIHNARHSCLLLRKRACPFIGAKQIPAFHPRKARAPLAVVANLALRANGKFTFANVADALQRGGVLPNLLKLLAPKISRRHRQLNTRVNFTVWRNVTAVVAGATRQILIRGTLHSARNAA